MAHINWSILGHGSQKRFLEQLVFGKGAKGTYLLSGPAHAGKTAAALDVARALLCRSDDLKSPRPCKVCAICRLPLDSNPDLAVIDRADEIKIQDIRELRKKMSLKAFGGGRKAVIIGSAENLNLEAANALLKFLEEPDEQTVIFLSTSRPQSLPATVLSRSSGVRFGFPDGPAVEEFYATRASGDKLKRLRAICGPRLGWAARALAEPDFAEALFSAEKELTKILAMDAGKRLEFTEEAKDLESGELGGLLFRWLVLLENALPTAPDHSVVASFARRADKLSAAMRDLNHNLNKKLVLDNLLVNL